MILPKHSHLVFCGMLSLQVTEVFHYGWKFWELQFQTTVLEGIFKKAVVHLRLFCPGFLLLLCSELEKQNRRKKALWATFCNKGKWVL